MKKKLHYCWLILFSCCMLQGAGFGVVSNCSGLFYDPVAKELGFSIGSISVYSSISVITSCVVMLFVTRLLEKYPVRLVLTMGAVCTSGPMLVMSVCDELWQWYALAVVQGMGLAFTMNLVAPIILNNWFHERIGLALGLSVSSSGIVGAVMSAVLGVVIRDSGWRAGYRLAGSVGLIMTVPVCMFILYMRPEDKGLRPYGERETKTEPQKTNACARSYRELVTDVRLWLLVPVIAVTRISTSFVSHISIYGNSVGFAMLDASILTTLFMIGNMLSKIWFGSLNDRYGAQKCSYLGLAIVFISELMLLSAADMPLMIGALLFGTVSMFSQVQLVILCRNSWNGSDYEHAMVAVQIISQVSFSLGLSGLGFAYDFLGDYRPLIGLLALMGFVSAAFVRMIFRRKDANDLQADC